MGSLRKKIGVSLSIFAGMFIGAWLLHLQVDRPVEYLEYRHPEDPSKVRILQEGDPLYEQLNEPFKPREYIRIIKN